MELPLWMINETEDAIKHNQKKNHKIEKKALNLDPVLVLTVLSMNDL